MKNYFSGRNDHPQHVSVGAILVNDGSTGSPQEKNKICCHHFNTEKLDLRGYWTDQKVGDFYILMRETIESGETLENALYRGLMEEFGAEAEILDYVGSIQCYFKNKNSDSEIQKTTLYFLCKLKSQDLSRRSGGIESKSQLEWQTAEFLIPQMKSQALEYNRADIDESSILERVQKLGFFK